jgi:molecular chaperone DnaK
LIVGIDFGTTNSLIANSEIFINERGSRITPSIVFFRKENEILVGDLAKSQMYIRPDRVVLNVKRDLGKGKEYVIYDKKFKAEEIASFIFRKLKNIVNEEITDAVVTVPAYFDDNQRNGVLEAASLAGLNVVKLLNEPVAAAIAYGINERDKKVLVLDFGGGTFDITLMEIKDDVFNVIKTGGSSELGGIDFDKVIVDWIVNTIYERDGINLGDDPVALQQIYNHVESAKIDLSVVDNTDIVIPYISTLNNRPYHLNINITRDMFLNISNNLIKKIEDLIKESANDDIDEIIFVGGSSRLFFFKDLVQQIFPDKKIIADLNPEELVVKGAGIYSQVIEGKNNIILKDILPHSLGVLDDEGNFIEILKKGMHYPTSETEIFTNTQDNQDTIIIKVLQKKNNEMINLGNFEFKFSNKWKKNEARIAVNFSLNINGVLEVSAEDIYTGQSLNGKITNAMVNSRKLDTVLMKKYKII